MGQNLWIWIASRLLGAILRLDRRWHCIHLAALGVRISRSFPGKRHLFPVTTEVLGSSHAIHRMARFLETVASLKKSKIQSLLSVSLRVSFVRAWKRKSPLRAVLLLLPTPCHVNCKGCFFTKVRPQDLSVSSWKKTVDELSEAGVYIIHTIGHGELFEDSVLADHFLDVVADSPDQIFIVFTSGTGISERQEKRVIDIPNLFPVLSIDGLKAEHDARRGDGVWDKVTSLMSRFRSSGKLCAFSCTAMSSNWKTVTSLEFAREMANRGAVMGIYFRERRAGDPKWGTDREFVQPYHEAFQKMAHLAPIPLVDQELYEQKHGCRVSAGAMVTVDLFENNVSPCVTCAPGFDIHFDPEQRGSLTQAVQKVLALRGWEGKCSCLAVRL